MKMPGFTGEESLGPSIGSYHTRALSLYCTKQSVVLPTQIHHPFPLPTGGYPIPDMPPQPPYNPIGTWPTTPPLVGGGAVAGGTAGGISLWWLIPGAIVGTIIGGAAGLGIEWLLTPETPTTTLPPTCRTTSRPPVTGTITGCYWGCGRSLAKTINDAEEFCGKLTNYCTGTCPDGTPCKPNAAAIPRPNQPLCWFGCETTVDFTCACGC